MNALRRTPSSNSFRKRFRISPGGAFAYWSLSTRCAAAAPETRSDADFTTSSSGSFSARSRSDTMYERAAVSRTPRSEEHTSELQSLRHLVCRLLLEKKKKKNKNYNYIR